MLLSNDEYQRIEVITGTMRRRRWSTQQKLRTIEESYQSGTTVSEVARRHGVAANLLFRWRKLLADGGAAPANSDEDVVGASEVKMHEARVRELERLLGRKTMEVEILKEALDNARAKNRRCCPPRQPEEVAGEDDRNDVRYRSFPSQRTFAGQLGAASKAPFSEGCGGATQSGVGG